MINLNYPNILQYIGNFIAPKRTESASFLIWYLVNYFRLDSLEAIDCVCDNNGDKGVDGIYVSENDNTIYIFQSKISQNIKSFIGDTSLKEFYGTLSQFDSIDTLKKLTTTAGKAEVGGLINRQELFTKLTTHLVKGIFLSNVELDANGSAYLSSIDKIQFIGKGELEKSYISEKREITTGKEGKFDISGYDKLNYYVDNDTKTVIAPIKATELVELEGISDQSIFAHNIRGPLGRTQVNRDIEKSIKTLITHKQFPLFHNGITIICNSLENNDDEIIIKTYFVVNGCQSLFSLYQNKTFLTQNLRILTKFVQVGVNSKLSEDITNFSNNQNGVKARDFKSNNPIQIRLQNEINQHYGNDYFYEIKRGELNSNKTVISNELIGILLWVFDLKEPWNTHRRYQVFEDLHSDIFGRPEVNSHRILMLFTINKIIESIMAKIDNKLLGKYILTNYTLLYILRQILENDDSGKDLIKNPKPYVETIILRNKLVACVSRLLDDIVVDLNAEVNELGEDFDYKSKLRDESWVKAISSKVVTSYLKLVTRKRINSFKDDWNT